MPEKKGGFMENEKRVKIYANVMIGISGIIPDGEGERVPIDDSAEIGRVIARAIAKYKESIVPELLEQVDERVVLRIDY